MKTEELLVDTRTRLKSLEDTIEEADLAGIKIQLDKTGQASNTSFDIFYKIAAVLNKILQSSSRRICKSQINGFFDDVRAAAERCTVLEKNHEKMAVFLDKTNKKVSWVETTLIPEVRHGQF